MAFWSSHQKRLQSCVAALVEFGVYLQRSEEVSAAHFPGLQFCQMLRKRSLRFFFQDWATALLNPLVPGAHVLVATNVLLSSRVQAGIEEAGFEYRGQIIRLYRGMRGGDRPKLAEGVFPDVAVSLRGAHEPWLLFRKPIEAGLRVSENLEKWGTGGLRRVSRDQPFPDVIQSERTPKIERDIANHPTIKPQSLMRALVQIMLPLGKGRILDPFMGSGSTIAAADNVGYDAVGVEIDSTFFEMAKNGIPKLADLGRTPCVRSDASNEELQLFV